MLEERWRVFLAIPVRSGICSWSIGFRGATAPWQCRQTVLRPAQCWSWKVDKQLKHIPKRLLEVIRSSSSLGGITFTSMQLVALFLALLRLHFFRFIAYLTISSPSPLLSSILLFILCYKNSPKLGWSLLKSHLHSAFWLSTIFHFDTSI